MEATPVNHGNVAFTAPTFHRNSPADYMMGIMLGGMAGGITAMVAGVLQMDDPEGAAILIILLMPFFGVGGATCGAILKIRGSRSILPVCCATIGGSLLSIANPLGWIIGGGMAGIMSGLSDRCLRRLTRRVVVGWLVGTGAWLATWGYIIGMGWLLKD